MSKRTDSGSGRVPDTDTSTSVDNAEISFLVTRWLLGFSNQEQDEHDPERRNAFERIRRATSEIASSFEILGAYGSVNRPSLDSSFSQRRSNANFSDLRRQWPSVTGEHLETIVGSVVAGNQVGDEMGRSAESSNLVQAAVEANSSLIRNPRSGRTLQEAIAIDTSVSEREAPNAPSVLQRPVLLASTNRKDDPGSSQTEKETVLQSSFDEILMKATRNVRRFLSVREELRNEDSEIQSVRRSLAIQSNIRQNLDRQRQGLSNNPPSDEVTMHAMNDEIREGEQNWERVTVQLNRRLQELERTRFSLSSDLESAEQEVASSYQRYLEVMRRYRDPIFASDGPALELMPKAKSSVLSALANRERALGWTSRQKVPQRRLIAGLPNRRHYRHIHKAMLFNRLSHAVTINAHISFPVYCLRFDRTGRYFVTGADDYLIKVFCVGAAQSCDVRELDGSRVRRCNYGANARGAVLVCSLRGHAGVINDIAVSSDNAFLATASVDGDCRIWGLKDGCPVAILRGHKGGANMVSWSTLSPFRLVTTGADGFARSWDIREAALKRYGAVVGKRPEYRLQLTPKEKLEREKHSLKKSAAASTSQEAALPPLPQRQNRTNGDDEYVPGGLPLLAAVANGQGIPGPGAAQLNDETLDTGGSQANIEPGQFVANDLVDEGVKLIAKFQHGASVVDSGTGPETRSRAGPVKVICVARCPLGGQFATGSDDGICRVWEDKEDESVAIVDGRHLLHGLSDSGKSHEKKPEQASPKDQPLLELTGHVGAITDLQYSHAGHRILTASQKDGVVRIWSLVPENPAASKSEGGKCDGTILINLTNPHSRTTTQSSRRRGGTASTAQKSNVSCDVAVWTHDDSRLITSQCCLVKQNGSEIHPGSQFIFLWDSRTGHCLVGVAGAHSMQCPVLIPHPSDSSLVCSAGADGFVKVWDWESGQCAFAYENIVEFGPADTSEKGKASGFLDGAFCQDGYGIVLTDDCGRVTILDSFCSSAEIRSIETDEEWATCAEASCPLWMREQYFANDYYDLFYDSNGYCVEKGSGQPPHLAPKGVRTSHSGAPYPETLNEVFSNLAGPMPLSEHVCRLHRGSLRLERVSRSNLSIRGAQTRKVTMSQFDPATTVLVKAGAKGDSCSVRPMTPAGPFVPALGVEDPRTRTPTSSERRSTHTLSSNYRWRDYADVEREDQDDDDADTDDDEFRLPSGQAASNNELSDVLTDVSDDDEMLEETDRSRRSRRRHEQRGEIDIDPPHRPSRRGRARSHVESESEDESVVEVLSTNNTPYGRYADDFAIGGHMFKLPPRGRVKRRWLRRVESNTSFSGERIYSPQLGDSVVYIPRVHFEMIKVCPTLPAPWKKWGNGSVWPVVRCRIRDIRYRFPFQDYYNKGPKLKSIVAILSLDVTGIPELAGGRELPWPKPSFVTPAQSHSFELNLFDGDLAEYVIPEGLYTWRLQCLEDAHHRSGLKDLELIAFYSQNGDDEDAAMTAFPARVKDVVSVPANQEDDHHLRGSGFETLVIEWNDGTSSAQQISPWEVNVAKVGRRNPAPQRPKLSEDELLEVRSALKKLRESNRDAHNFALPVNDHKYIDYALRVEIPMDLHFIEQRLDAGYYARKSSVVADVRLIRDNCVKYNGILHPLSHAAGSLFLGFEASLLGPGERLSDLEVVNDDTAAPTTTPPQHLDSEPDDSSSGQRRVGPQTRSSLEQLPRPAVVHNLIGPRPQRGSRSTSDDNSTSRQSPLSATDKGSGYWTRSSRNSRPLENRNGKLDGSAGGLCRQASVSAPEELDAENSNHEDAVNDNKSINDDEEMEQIGPPAGRTTRNYRLRDETDRPIQRPSRKLTLRMTRSHGSSSSNRDHCATRQSSRLSSENDEESRGLGGTENGSSPNQWQECTPNSSEGIQVSPLRMATRSTDRQRQPPKQDLNPSPSYTTRSCSRKREKQTVMPDAQEQMEQEAPSDADSSSPGVSEEESPQRKESPQRHSRAKKGPQKVERPVPYSLRTRQKNCSREDAIPDAEDPNDSGEEPSEKSPPASPCRRSSRLNSSSSRPGKSNSAEEKADADNDEPFPQTRRRLRSTPHVDGKATSRPTDQSAARNPRKNRSRTTDATTTRDSDPAKNNIDRQPRQCKRSINYEVPSSGEDDYSGNSEQETNDGDDEFDLSDGGNSEDVPPATTRISPHSSSGRASTRRTRQTEHAYYDEDDDSEDESSDGSSDGSSEHKDEYRIPPRKRKGGDKNAGRKTASKKARKSSFDNHPKSKVWPNIPIKRIGEVGEGVIRRMAELDGEGLFCKPVGELYPDLAILYASMISEPMDFRTIEEDHLPTYGSIRELQRHIVLVLKNCVDFNGDGSDFSARARFLLGSLDDVFRSVCEELGVSTRRGWGEADLVI